MASFLVIRIKKKSAGSHFFSFPLACCRPSSAYGIAAGTPRLHRVQKTSGVAPLPKTDGRTARCVETVRRRGLCGGTAVRPLPPHPNAGYIPGLVFKSRM